MKRIKRAVRLYCCVLALLVFALTGCAKEDNRLAENQLEESSVLSNNSQTEEKSAEERKQTEEKSAEKIGQTEEAVEKIGQTEEAVEEIGQTEEAADKAEEEDVEPVITEVDWSDYFEGIHGAAVIYTPTDHRYHIYNQELATTRRSPCSTFKIISSFIALENGIIEPDHSTRIWSGEAFWNENWNRDLDFYDAFQSSCVWYFREVIDEIGSDLMQDELSKLQYGNCDISDWSGELNTNNSNTALNGFWLESSLLISPKEQTEAMERIFGDNQTDSEATQNQLKQVMLLSECNDSTSSIYGKTGMGSRDGTAVDAWFTGFADRDEKRIYFCVYLGETANQDVTSAKAREIAVKIVSDYLK